MVNLFFKNKKSSDERGAFAVVLAVALIPMLIAVGAAIDLSRAYVVKTRIAFALDAAGLAVGSSYSENEEEMRTVMEAYFLKNYPDSAIGTQISLDLVIDESIITMSATYQIPTTFMAIANIDTIDVSVSNEITRETKGLEVALVLDNTGSMNSYSKIDTLKVAAKDLINILFGSQNQPDALKTAIVPYVTTVNIGRGNKAFVDFSGSVLTGNDATDMANYGTVWKGCVTARNYPYNVQTGAIGGLWKPYVWPMEPRYRYSSGTYSSYCANKSNSYGTKWGSIDETPLTTYGPNKSCPRALSPLTNDKLYLVDEIDSLTPWYSSGTMAHMGVFWGTEVLTPEAPFSQGAAFDDQEWNKAMVIMTDGVNELVRQNSRCYSSSTRRPVSAQWPDGGPYTNYSGEGYPVDDERLPLVGGTDYEKYTNMKTLMNQYTLEACEHAKSLGIIVYTITFQLNDATMQNLYKQCATDESKYYNSPTNEDLRRAFRAIGAELSNLRLSK
jgi:Flp pilus assembly protein TadG